MRIGNVEGPGLIPVAEPSLLNWIEQCLQALKMSEKETNESKLFLSLGTAFQKEFDQLK